MTTLWRCETKNHEDGRKRWYYTAMPPIAPRSRIKPLATVVTGSQILAQELACSLDSSQPVILVGAKPIANSSIWCLPPVWTTPEVWELISHQYTIHTIYHLAPWDMVDINDPAIVFERILSESSMLMAMVKSLATGGLLMITPDTNRCSLVRNKAFAEAMGQLERQIVYVAQTELWPYALLRWPFCGEEPDTMSPNSWDVIRACKEVGQCLNQAINQGMMSPCSLASGGPAMTGAVEIFVPGVSQETR
ncbi:hypothetical protein [Sulfobacillus thermosulfidooxidans]|uniref:hypothetical protein n=1 Tax=Sulfobacillus thermosulfidooxidans TaxID=28034 RepID=UPI0006B58D3C|nr:hypothetical protein [Sulfobacillus thermosulfidooxidans]